MVEVIGPVPTIRMPVGAVAGIGAAISSAQHSVPGAGRTVVLAVAPAIRNAVTGMTTATTGSDGRRFPRGLGNSCRPRTARYRAGHGFITSFRKLPNRNRLWNCTGTSTTFSSRDVKRSFVEFCGHCRNIGSVAGTVVGKPYEDAMR